MELELYREGGLVYVAVDGLVAESESALSMTQAARYLFRRPSPLQALQQCPSQLPVAVNLEDAGNTAGRCLRMRGVRQVADWLTVALYLPADGRYIPAQLPGNGAPR